MVAATIPILLLALGSARAAEVPVDIALGPEGTVVATVLLPAEEEAVRRILDDPVRSAHLTPDLLSVDVAPTRPPCSHLDGRTRGLTRPLAYRVVRCPTAHGWRESLVSSEDFRRYEVEWQIVPVSEGVRVEYRVAIDVNLPVPGRLVSENVKRSARLTLQALFHAIAPGAPEETR